MRLHEWLARFPAFAADGEGSGTGSGSGDGSSDGDGADDAASPGGGSILDTATKKAGAGDDDGGGDDDKPGDGDDKDAGDIYDPGKLPDGVLGKSNSETIDNLLARHNDLRREISKGKHKDAADIPDAADGYKLESKGDDDLVALALNGEGGDEVMEIVRAAAMEAKMGQGQFDSFVRSFMEKGGDVGLLLTDEDATRINGQAELADLVKETGSEKAARSMVDAVAQYGEMMIERELMTRNDLTEWNTMFGTAKSTKIMYSLLTSLAGYQPVPLTGERGETTYTAPELYAMKSKALNLPPGEERTAELKRVERLFETTFGNEPASDSREVRRRAAG